MAPDIVILTRQFTVVGGRWSVLALILQELTSTVEWLTAYYLPRELDDSRDYYTPELRQSCRPEQFKEENHVNHVKRPRLAAVDQPPTLSRVGSLGHRNMHSSYETLRGLTLVEVTIAMMLTSVGIVSLAGVLLSVQRQHEQASARSQVLQSAANILEEIKGSPLQTVYTNYHGRSYEVAGVSGTGQGGLAIDVAGVPATGQIPATGQGGSVISVSVDPTNPKLLVVTLNASWIVLGNTETLELQTEIYSLKGQE